MPDQYDDGPAIADAEYRQWFDEPLPRTLADGLAATAAADDANQAAADRRERRARWVAAMNPGQYGRRV